MWKFQGPIKHKKEVEFPGLSKNKKNKKEKNNNNDK